MDPVITYGIYSEISTTDRPRLIDGLRPWLCRLSLPEPARQIGTTDSTAYLEATLRDDDQLASVMPHPIVHAPYDISIQVHETLIDNLFTTILAGRTLKQGEVAEMLADSGLKLGPATLSDQEKTEEPFEIDFEPLSFSTNFYLLEIVSNVADIQHDTVISSGRSFLGNPPSELLGFPYEGRGLLAPHK